MVVGRVGKVLKHAMWTYNSCRKSCTTHGAGKKASGRPMLRKKIKIIKYVMLLLLASFDQRASSFAFFSMDTSRCTHNITLEKKFTSKLYAKKP